MRLNSAFKREHRAKNVADRSEVVVGDPASEAQQLIVEDRRGIDHAKTFFVVTDGLRSCSSDDDAGDALLAKRNEDASAHDGRGIRGDTVGEDHVERNRESYVAELGHWMEG